VCTFAHSFTSRAAVTMAVSMAATVSGLCEVGQMCLKGEEVFYPGSTFFIDPEGMTPLQLLFVFLVYGYVLFVSADMIGDGAELLLLVPGYADMVGSIVLPILGAIPDGMMVLFSGVGPIEIAQENVAVGVGALAGSTIMLLTLPWVLSVFAGLVDMDKKGKCVGYGAPVGKRRTGTAAYEGLQFNEGVTKNAYLMLITSLGYFVIQIPALMVDDQKTKAEYASTADYIAAVEFESTSENTYAMVGFVVTMILFFFYMYLQYVAALKKEPCMSCLKALLPPPPPPLDIALVKQHGVLPLIDHYRQNFEKTKVIADDKEQPLAKSSQLPQDLNSALKSLFNEFAAKTPDCEGLHPQDMRELLRVIGLCYTPDAFKVHFDQADKDHGGSLDKGEFLTFFFEMITGKEALPHEKALPAAAAAGGDDEDEEEDEMPEEFKDLPPAEQQKQIIKASVKQMLMGTFLVLIFSDPMVDVLAQIGKMTGVPAFYVSFILAPLASNASELVCSMALASKKTQSSITQSLQTLEGAACMNNTFCLGIFFFLIYYQGLAWKFTAETLCIFFVQFLMFLIVVSSSTQTKKTGFVIFLLYPLSLVFVAGLESMGLD